jgi:hypothetical protein
LKKIDVKKLDPRKLDLKKLDAKTARLGLAGLLVVIAVLIGAIALLSDGSGGGGSESSAEKEGEAKGGVALSASELIAKAGSLGRPAYWIGPRAGTTSYELSVTPDGRIYVRYLTGGAEAGDPKPDFLTVGTYPVPEAAQALQDATTGAAGSQTLTQHEGYEVLSSAEATNAYVVFDDQPDIQVEVFSPQRGEAAQLAGAGSLKPLG